MAAQSASGWEGHHHSLPLPAMGYENDDAGSLELGFVYIRPACSCRARSWTSSSPCLRLYSAFILLGRAVQVWPSTQHSCSTPDGNHARDLGRKSLLHKQGSKFCLAVARASARRAVAQPAWFLSLRRQRQEILKTSWLERPCLNE